MKKQKKGEPIALSRRKFVALGMAAGAGALINAGGDLSYARIASRLASRRPTAIDLENAKPGDSTWKLTQPALEGQIEGYASSVSVNRGEQITFFVSTSDPSFTMKLYRMGWYGGVGARSMGPAIRIPGVRQPEPFVDPDTLLTDAGNWSPSYTLTIPHSLSGSTGWPSGVYLAKLTASSGWQTYIIFVVRDDGRKSDLLFQTSVTTYQAYNAWGERGLYTKPRAFKVSFNRPYTAPRAQSKSMGCGDFLFWEYNLVRFLEREGYDITYNTDLDTHLNGAELLLHKAFLSVGHDEYWSWQMRQHVTAARDAKVNLAFFAANCCYWQIRFEPSPVTGISDRTIVCYKADALSKDPYSHGPQRYLTTTNWRASPVNMPEGQLIGVMYDGEYRVDADMVVSETSNFIFRGTGLWTGDRLPGLLGYEPDELFPQIAPDVISVAQSPYTEMDKRKGVSHMVFYRADSGATVVSTGSMQWNWGLDDYNRALKHKVLTHPGVQQATRNILREFGVV